MFNKLKFCLTTAPFLKHVNHSLPTKVEIDALNGMIVGALSQKHNNVIWHPVGFYLESLKGAELKYPVHDKELFVIV